MTSRVQVVIDPLTIVTDDGKASDELGKALAQMLQSDLESRASERQNADEKLALVSLSNKRNIIRLTDSCPLRIKSSVHGATGLHMLSANRGEASPSVFNIQTDQTS